MISDDDRSFLYGDGLFETVRVERDGGVELGPHLARFEASARALGFPPAIVVEGLDALRALRKAEAGVWRVTVSRPGEGVSFGGSGGVQIRRRDFPAVIRPRLGLAEGLYLPDDLFAEHKTTSAIRNVEARRRAQEAGFDDAIMVAADKSIGEASFANVFVVFDDGSIATPAVRGILPGTTRARVLEALGRRSREVSVRRIEVGELARAAEIWLTSAGIGVVGAQSLNGRPLADSVAREVAQWLR